MPMLLLVLLPPSLSRAPVEEHNFLRAVPVRQLLADLSHCPVGIRVQVPWARNMNTELIDYRPATIMRYDAGQDLYSIKWSHDPSFCTDLSPTIRHPNDLKYMRSCWYDPSSVLNDLDRKPCGSPRGSEDTTVLSGGLKSDTSTDTATEKFIGIGATVGGLSRSFFAWSSLQEFSSWCRIMV